MSNQHPDPIKSWEVRASTGKHFDFLDGIRGIAILMVVATHTFYVNPHSVLGHSQAFIGNLNTGVQLFFVLSGFLISFPFFREKAQSKPSNINSYTRRRIAKIAPPYYLSIAVFTLWYWLWFSDPAYLKAAVSWASGAANFFPPDVRFNASYWSLLVEIQFYILLPVLFLCSRKMSIRQTCIAIFLVLLLVPFVSRQLSWPKPEDYARFAPLWPRFPYQLDFFAWGILFAGIFVLMPAESQKLRRLAIVGYAGMILLVVTLGLLTFWAIRFNTYAAPQRWSLEANHLLTGLSTFLMLFFVFDQDCLGSRILSNAPLRFVGLVSYEWFLFHQPIVYFFHDHFGFSQGSAIKYAFKTLFPLAMTFGFSVLLYRYFSLPLSKRIRGSKSQPK